MDLGLGGKSALLIGAGRGLGAAAALALAREGCKVAVVARTQETVERRAAACREAGAPVALAFSADACDPAALATVIERTARELGSIDILVNLVGGSQPGGSDAAPEMWQQAMERNLWPAVRATQLALPYLTASAARRALSAPAQTLQQARVGAGSAPDDPCGPLDRDASVVVHVASIFGREGGGSLSYNVAKAALISLAHEQARELARRGVRVLSVAPGSILHPGGSWERRLQADPAGTTEFVKREIPFGRFGTAEEVGEVLAFLCSPRASWVAGACVVIDGGQSRAF